MIHYIKQHKYTSKNTNFLFLLFFSVVFNLNAQKIYTVVLDAGHGGKDSGALKHGRVEKKIALSVVLKAGKILEKQKNVKIVYTRKKDVFVELHKRAAMANKIAADLFVSVHCNAHHKAFPYGAETFVLGVLGNGKNTATAKRENAVIQLEDNYKKNYDYDPNAPESVIGLSVLQEENLDASVVFGGLIQSNFSKARRKDRSVQQANFLVLRETIMPSVLVELGFLSNEKEGRFLNSRKGQNLMAKSIANAVIDYVDRIQKSTVNKKRGANKRIIKKKIKRLKAKTKKQLAKPKAKKKKLKKPIVKKVYYSVQIAASKKYKKNDLRRFRPLRNIKIKKIGSMYVYLYGEVTSFRDARKLLAKAKKSGVSDAFILPLNNRVMVK